MKLLYLVESGKSKFLVFDEMPDKISTKYGDDTIIGRIGGVFYDFLAKRNERREAFGGRKFDIVLDNGEIEKCEGQWWDAVTDRAREELEKEGNPLSKMVLIGVSSVDRLLDCYVYCGLWASESKIKEMIAEYKGRIYEYYEFKEEVINKINETRRKLYIQSWIEKHMEEAHKAKMAAKRAEICERYDKKIRQAEAEKKIMLCVFDYGLSTDNVIYYSHTNTLSFNWNGYGEKITQEEFDDFVNKVDRSQLPEGIKFELK